MAVTSFNVGRFKMHHTVSGKGQAQKLLAVASIVLLSSLAHNVICLFSSPQQVSDISQLVLTTEPFQICIHLVQTRSCVKNGHSYYSCVCPLLTHKGVMMSNI